jgi:hypothetical protein
MRKSRPCRICRHWFLPHPRAGNRQTVCSSPACQRERHRRSCAQWHSRNPDYDREERLRRKLCKDTPATTVPADPVPVRIDRAAARDAVGVEVTVVIEETAKVLVDWARDAVMAQAYGITAESGEHLTSTARDEIGIAGPGP